MGEEDSGPRVQFFSFPGALLVLLQVYFSSVETLHGFAKDMGLFVPSSPLEAHGAVTCLETVASWAFLFL